MISSLIISNNISALHAYAKGIVGKFNPADIFWLKNEESLKSSIGVKETVEFMERAHLAPVGDSKLMIICDFATVTPQAQNKMLKTIEDAPAKTNFLLLATNIEPVLNTIKSRCVTTYLPVQKSAAPLVPKDIATTLEKVFGVKIDESILTAKQKQGILDILAKINRNVAANCNETNHKDLLIMEILKYAKNS